MMRINLILAVALLLFFNPIAAGAAGKNARQVVMALTEVATGTPITVSSWRP